MWFATRMPLSVIRHDDAAEFLDRVGGFLGDHEAENNLLFGILTVSFVSVVGREGA